jgi:homoserine kinase
VPATVGNFGDAAECGTLALDASLNVKVTRRQDGHVSIRYFGENGERVPRDRSNLVVRAIEAALHTKQREFTGADLEIYSSVPVAVGLGSSTAAVMAGLIAANLLYRLGLDEKSLFELAGIYEQRNGNLRAAWLGGFVAGAGDASGKTADDPFVYQRTIVPENLVLHVVVPETTLVPGKRAGAKSGRGSKRSGTKSAGKISGGMAAGAAGKEATLKMHRAAALTEFFAQQGSGSAPELDNSLPPTCEKKVAGLEEALQVRTPGALSVFVCGSGPAVGIFATENAVEAVRAVREAFARHHVATDCYEFRPTNVGALDWNRAYGDATLPASPGLGDILPKINSLPV